MKEKHLPQDIEWYTTGQAARLLGQCGDTVRKYIPDMPSTYIIQTRGGHYRIHRDGIEMLRKYRAKK